MGRGLVRGGLWRRYHRDWLVRLGVFVFGSGLQLLATEIESNHVLLFSEIKTQRAPADRDFSRSHPKEPAEIDDRGVRLPFFVEQHVDDPPHTLACRAQHLLPQYPQEVVPREIVETGAVQRRVLGRLIGWRTGRRLRRR